MNIFEDLIDELKEENLLEETVIESAKSDADEGVEKSDGEKVSPEVSTENNFAEQNVPLEIADDEEAADNQIFIASEPSANKADFYRKRATEEVTGLQMVEHIFSGVERQQKKMMPKVYDDLSVKRALHAFLQISGDPEAPEHAQAEFQLMQETEAWYSALSHRDKQISIAHLRRYCETAKPVLSSQALIGLARFYRNSPYSEAVRSKFDLIITRLFSKEKSGEKRELAFQRDDLMRHLSELYADWESVSLYSNTEGGDEESETLLTAFKFEDFMTEAESADNFDELVRNDFFNRLRTFKQTTNEQFFAPLVAATAVESNVRIGNRYIELIEKEKENGELEKLENKYGFLHDQVISDATSKTLQLVELLRLKPEEPPQVVEQTVEKSEKETVKKESAPVRAEPKQAEAKVAVKSKNSFFAVNKWLLASSVVIIVLSVAIYMWADMKPASAEKISEEDVKIVRLENSSLSEFMRDARIGNSTFFAIVKPSWETLNQDKKEELLRKILTIGTDKNFKRVHLLSASGKTVGTIADGVVEVND